MENNNNRRAQQFMPFASLRGYYNLINEEAKVLEPKRELSEEECEKLSYKLNQIKKGMMIKITYYNIDSYTTKEGLVSSIDEITRTITIVKTKINFDDISNIEGENISFYRD